ncbi:MAG: shikimate dehydrogenase [Syntrophomonas sp.]|nr:shikimate dehydrogenase [Syntrophomonas sp.]
MIINNDTILMGVIGNPIKHSLSPLMHNRAIEILGLNYIYLPFEVAPERLDEAVAAVRALNLQGINVTVPFKEKVIPYLDAISPGAEACAAVNLIKNEDGRLTGYNTDGRGFMVSLHEEGVADIKRVIFIGAGGAARALAYELALAGISEINFLDIDRGKAQELAIFVNKYRNCQGAGYKMSEEIFASLSQDADLIINCTPVGMFPHVDSTPVSSLQQASPHTVVYDLVYNPLMTRFLAMAQARQLKNISGLLMLVHQGAIAFEILTGCKPPVNCMKEVVCDYFKQS